VAGIDRHAEAAVALVLERLHLAEAHRDGQSGGHADARFGRRRAARTRERKRPLDDLLERFLVGLRRLRHESARLYRPPAGPQRRAW